MNYFNSDANNIHPDIIIESKFHSLFEKNCSMVVDWPKYWKFHGGFFQLFGKVSGILCFKISNTDWAIQNLPQQIRVW